MEIIEILILLLVLVVDTWAINALVYLCSSQDGGEVFGVIVPPDKKSNRRTIIFLIIGGIFSFVFGTASMGSLFSILFMLLATNFILFMFIISLLVGFGVWFSIKYYRRQIKKASEQTNALILGELPMLQEIDKLIEAGEEFFVDYKGVYVKNAKGSDAVYYTAFGYPNLVSEKELGVLGQYFAQRHHDFALKQVKMNEVTTITYYRGAIYGTQGVQFINTQSTATQGSLAGYRFVRK